jgi:hypothetical protein
MDHGMDWLFSDPPPKVAPVKSPSKPKKSRLQAVACATPVAVSTASVPVALFADEPTTAPGTCGACHEYKASSLAGHGYCRKASSMIDRARFVPASTFCWLHQTR